MIFVSHRGNVSGKNVERENTESYITEAVNSSYLVEVDLWRINNKFYLGHNDPEHITSLEFLHEFKSDLLIHCKNIKSLEYMTQSATLYRYFYHEYEKYVLSSWGDIIIHSHTNRFPSTGIYMLPEVLGIQPKYLKNCAGICSDVVNEYKQFTWQ